MMRWDKKGNYLGLMYLTPRESKLAPWRSKTGTVHLGAKTAKAGDKTACHQPIRTEWKRATKRTEVTCNPCCQILMDEIREIQMRKQQDYEERETYGKPVRHMPKTERKKHYCPECDQLKINNGYPTKTIVSQADKQYQLRGAYGLNKAETHLFLKHREMSKEREARKNRIAQVISEHLTGRNLQVNSNFEITEESAKLEADKIAEKIMDTI